MGQPTDQVGRQDAVKRSEVTPQVHGISLLELAAVLSNAIRERNCQVALLMGLFQTGNGAGASFHILSRFCESMRVVDADDFLATTRHLVARTTDGTTNV